MSPWPYTFPFRFEDKADYRSKETSSYGSVENRSKLDTEYDSGVLEKSESPSSYQED